MKCTREKDFLTHCNKDTGELSAYPTFFSFIDEYPLKVARDAKLEKFSFAVVYERIENETVVYACTLLSNISGTNPEKYNFLPAVVSCTPLLLLCQPGVMKNLHLYFTFIIGQNKL